MDTALNAVLSFCFALPICTYIALSDLTSLRIPNRAVLALLCVFAASAGLSLSVGDIGLRLLQAAVLLAIGAALAAGGVLGAGDAKLAAVAALFVAPRDARMVLLILAVSVLAGIAAQTACRHPSLSAKLPEWDSLTPPYRFPMGLALTATLAIYLSLRAMTHV